jgi:hypothetical protein
MTTILAARVKEISPHLFERQREAAAGNKKTGF